MKAWKKILVLSVFVVLVVFVFGKGALAQTCSDLIYECGIYDGPICTGGTGQRIASCSYVYGECSSGIDPCQGAGECQYSLSGCSLPGGGGGGGGCTAEEECRTEQTCPASRTGASCGTTSGGTPKVCCAPAPGGGGGGSCTLTLTPSSTSVSVGSSVSFSASVNASQSGDYVQFLSSNTGIATVNPATDPDTPFTTQATGVSSGTVTITANAKVTGKERIYCSDTSSLSVTSTPPSCTVDLTPISTKVSIGSSTTFTASVSPVGGTVERVDFSLSNPARANLDPTSDTTPVYSTEATGQSVGTTSVTADVFIGGVLTCSDTSTLDVTQPGAWWQAIDADIAASGAISSLIPSSCSAPCTPNLILDGSGGFPGVPLYSGTISLESGDVSSTNWQAEVVSYTQELSFDYLSGSLPGDISFIDIASPTVPGSFFESGGSESYGYYWYRFDGATYGDLTVTSAVTIPAGRLVVLLVDGGNLTLEGSVNIASRGNGFFLALVGKDSLGAKGNLLVDAGVGGAADGVPEIEGLFLSEGAFSTGAGNNQLHVRGSIAAYGGITLERDLPNNTQTPAEVFEYAPELFFLYPPKLGVRQIKWKEVAP